MLIERAAARLAPGGRLAVGDLMAASRAAVDGVMARLQHPDADALFDEEFPWFVDETLGPAGRCGLHGCRGGAVQRPVLGRGGDAPLTRSEPQVEKASSTASVWPARVSST